MVVVTLNEKVTNTIGHTAFIVFVFCHYRKITVYAVLEIPADDSDTP